MNIPNLLLINPNIFTPPVYPLGLEYLAAHLNTFGINCNIFDYYENHSKKFLKNIDDYDAIGISIRNLDSSIYGSNELFLTESQKLICEIRGIKNIPIILGGTGFSISPKDILNYCDGDYGIAGDGERSFPFLLFGIMNNSVDYDLPGLVYRKNGVIIQNGWNFLQEIEQPNHLDKIQRKPNGKYWSETKISNIETKRGCDQKCIYCVDPICKGKLLRLRSSDLILEEINSLISVGHNKFHLCDSEFNIPADHATSICEDIIRNNLGKKIKWYAYFSPRNFTREFASILTKSGCQGVIFSTETLDEQMLDSLGKEYLPNDVILASQYCNDYEIPFLHNILLGGPGENKLTISNSLGLFSRLCKGRGLGKVAIGLRVYPNTRLAQMVKDQGKMVDNNDLDGEMLENDNFLKPVYFLSHFVKNDIFQIVGDQIGNNSAIFFEKKNTPISSFNYDWMKISKANRGVSANNFDSRRY